MRRIVFIDLTCPKKYSSETLLKEPIGGTEATVIRVADSLAKRGYDVIVAQHCRDAQDSEQQEGANYVSIEALEQIHSDPHAVIALRTPKVIPFIRKRWSAPKLFLWCHDFNQRELVQDYEVLAGTGIKILGVSRHHKSIIADALLSQIKEVNGVTVSFVYNPIADDLTSDDSTVYHKRLVYFSSPHKGLEQTLKMFERVRANDKQYELRIANPGYLPSYADALPEGVINLGSLPHAEMMKEVRQAFSVFHMNSYPETFGLVGAEALAVGTPMLTSRTGALPEILGDREYFVDITNEKEIIERLDKWQRNHRPVTKVNGAFRLSNVTNEWEKFFQ